MSRPFLTVLIDTYNHSAYIEQAVESVLSQDIAPVEMEVLVVDDGSTDDTPQRIRKFEPRVRYLRKPNGGQASAFNLGIPQARGEIIAFLDGDDWWAAGKLRTVLDTFADHPEIGAVGHGFWQLEESSGNRQLIIPDRSYDVSLRDAESASLFRHLRCFLGTSRFAARRTIAERILPIPTSLVVEADEFLFTMAVALGGAKVLDQPLFTYRLHDGNLFQFRGADDDRRRRKLAVHQALVCELPTRLRAAGICHEAIEKVIEPIWADAEVMRLQLEGGWPWETFRAERATARIAYAKASPGYHLFKSALLALALVLPPKLFYRLKAWYASRGLHRKRALVGKPAPAAPILQSLEASSTKQS